MHAWIDESGQRAHSPASSDHFVLAAAVARDQNLHRVSALLASLRNDLQRPPHHELSWKNFRSHSDRLHIAKTVGGQSWLRTISVVAAKRHLPPTDMNQSQIYLYQLRFLLERLSWCAEQHRQVSGYTLAHIKGFKVSELRHYEEVLRNSETSINWDWLDPKGGAIDQPKRIEELQLADLVASATGAAVNPDKFGQVEPRYVVEMQRLIWRRAATSAVTSYGLKVHPWNDAVRAAHPWIAAL